MADAVQYDIMIQIQTDLRTLTFSAQGSESVRTINDAAIVWEKAVWRDGKIQFRNKECPGIVITPANLVTMPMRAGENKRDEVTYRYLCQIIDTDQEHRTHGLRTYMKWQEQIAKIFRNQDIGISSIYSNEGGVTSTCECESMDTIDENLFYRHQRMVAAVQLAFIALEPRGSS
jgi:hypothetical protein